ncbi:DNA damage-inducible protein 1 [Friedmanniomyces endolithicus]|uniref:DNA damage-inducible protein 1 n=1 Tax=Friedmanniomyces endolithicus TaxID=329885 RepID=A0AAN6H7T7_9PEZI|nr:DNA damage-inducible protein 1 [Friedmanniomyces endolithicus]KAK0771479.1 DNA damage-inducible protein 1 [Friedmanniomyces endolithicus]KAK0788936.1 DNA damage-inducible protein 1 [Friedmanniomyces endolithicus]KAK0795321.1 DNA damage-inducible protein 1 [Friedmanniomyces endolithicus]KAK0839022.1 DNA damage-inducible protein 1 [Friedmanniomyces endolithicus]
MPVPRITISIIAPNHALDQELITLDLPPGLSVGDLKGFVNAETHLPQAAQQFYLNNTPIAGDDKTLEEAGVKDGDMLAMLMRQPEQQNNMNAQRRQQRRPAGRSPHEIETSRLSILGNPAAMAQVREQRPALAEAINDTNWFKEVWEKMDREDAEREQERREQMALLNEDPFNVEAQRKIEEMIRQESVQENLQFAYEHNPEVFGRVTMLYIPVEVNRHPVKAFVDSGAQTTIMSPSCAETCGIMRLIDKRYSGIAKGVGTAQILGRVHAADIRIGNSTMSCSFTVMEGKDVDLLLGLDMLKRFQAVIDLRGGKLVFGDGGNEVEFLGEADIPKGFEEARGREDVVEGPNGTEIGVESGTVRQAGATSSSASTGGLAGQAGSATNGFRGLGQALGASSSSSKSGKAAASNGPTHAPTPASTQRAPRSSAPAPARAPAAASTSTATQYPKEADQLVSLGFARNQAIAALDACGGDVEYAAGLLFQS